MTTTSYRSVANKVHTHTRRRLLWWGLAGAGGLGLAATARLSWLARSATDSEAVPYTFKHLTDAEYHLFRRAAQVLLPTENTALPSFESVPFFANIDHLFGLLDENLQRDVHRLLFLFDHAPLFSHGQRFVDLPDDVLRQLMDRWSEGNLLQRALGSLIKQFVYVNYWQEPATWQVLEYDGPVSERWGLPYLGNAPLPVDDQQERAV